jgi:hypothetical protein
MFFMGYEIQPSSLFMVFSWFFQPDNAEEFEEPGLEEEPGEARGRWMFV